MLSVVIVLGRAGYLFQMVGGEKTRVEDLFSLNIRLFDPSCPREQLMSWIDWVLKIRFCYTEMYIFLFLTLLMFYRLILWEQFSPQNKILPLFITHHVIQAYFL